jgi:hypothetical protein
MLFVRDGLLFAQPATPGGVVTGDAMQVASNVGGATTDYASFSTSDDGVLAFAGANSQIGRLTWYDRTGKVLGTVGALGDYVNFEISPDQKRLAFSLVDAQLPSDWSPDGAYVVYHVSTENTGQDIWVAPMSGDRKGRPFLQTPFNEMQGRLSPDGRWMAYTSDESGSLEVYVRPFPTGAEKSLVSTNGGSDPVWRHEGKELFYLGADRKLMSVNVKSSTTFESDVPRPLFDAHVGALNPDYRNQYTVSSEGSRFLVNVVSEGSSSSPITVVLNWTEMLKK